MKRSLLVSLLLVSWKKYGKARKAEYFAITSMFVGNKKMQFTIDYIKIKNKRGDNNV